MSPTSRNTVLVIGANGYIGAAVARAFRDAGYVTLGLIRSVSARNNLEKELIIPVMGSAKDPKGVLPAVLAHTKTLNVVVSTTEDVHDYVPHFNDTVRLLRMLARASNSEDVRPLVLFTSGSKDYGRTQLEGAPDLRPQTEETPLHPPSFLAERAMHAIHILNETSFDAVLLRPTHVHGYSSSYFGQFFEQAATVRRAGEDLFFRADPRTILHSLHVDDCADAYVALASHPHREAITRQCFNLSAGDEHETLQDVGEELRALYGIKRGLVFDPPDMETLHLSDPLITFSQWVSSQKIRSLTGWTHHRPLFAKGISRYRDEYEAAVREQDPIVMSVRQRDLKNAASKGA